MVKSKQPKRKPIEYDYTYEKGPRHAWTRARKVTPKGMKFKSLYWLFDRKGKTIKARCVGVYSQGRGKPDFKMYLDTRKEHTPKPRKKVIYNGFTPTEPPKPLAPVPAFTPAPIPEKIIPMKVGIRRMLKEKDIVILYWAAKGETEWAQWAQKEAKRLNVKLPKLKKRKAAK